MHLPVSAPPLALVLRDSALQQLNLLKQQLASPVTEVQCARLISQVCAELESIQGDWRSRPHLAKSLCQVAHAVRKAGHPALAENLLERTLVRNICDQYLVSELVQCLLMRGRMDRAAEVITCDKSGASYSAVIIALTRAGSLVRARQLFEEACAKRLAVHCSLPIVLRGWTDAGRLAGARAMFELARAQRSAGPASYVIMINGYGRVGALRRARHIFEQAEQDGAAEAPVYTAMVMAMALRGRADTARRLLKVAVERGRVEPRPFAFLIHQFGRAGKLSAAETIFEMAATTDVDNIDVLTAMFALYVRAGRRENAENIVHTAGGRGLECEAMWNELRRLA